MKNLYTQLENYSKENVIPMHMPGHKRNGARFGMWNEVSYDITEIDGFDDYHYPEGIIYDIQKKASRIYDTKESFYMVNGSSGGILAAISAAKFFTKKNKIAVGRNCHKAVYNGILINNMYPVYVYPMVDENTGIMGQIRPEDIEKQKLEDMAALIITSPTYEGVVSDIEAIASICHSRGVILIVDGAHGAHFNYSEEFPKAAALGGADIVIESLHKTLPSPTQTAILHIGKESIIDRAIVKKFLSIYQTSSPSYVFMGEINRCIDYMVSEEGNRMLSNYIANLKKLRSKLTRLENITLIEYNGICYDMDISKLVLFSRGNGRLIHDILLNRFKIQIEMCAADYIIAMTSIGDRFEWYDSFFEAMTYIDKYLNEYKLDESKAESKAGKAVDYYINEAILSMSPYEASLQEVEYISIEDSLNKVCAETLFAYPPGIPILFPGEVITNKVLEVINNNGRAGIRIKGFTDMEGKSILCIR